MYKFFSVLLFLLISIYNLYGENPEISKKLLYAQTIDYQNENLGESIDLEVRFKLIKFIYDLSLTNFMIFSGFEFLDNKVDRDIVKLFYRAHADISYYSEEQIKEVKDFLIKDRIVFCKTKNFRKYLFL